MAVSIKIGVLFVDVLTIRVLVFGVYVKAPAFWKLSCLCGTCMRDELWLISSFVV